MKFLYKSKNEIFIQNYDLIILVSFYLGIKTVENQNKIPNLFKLKNIYKQKFGNYSNREIKESELVYIQILEYEINFMTIYDFLIYMLKNNNELIQLHRKNIDKLLKQNTIDFCTRFPMELIQEYTNNSQINKIMKYPFIIQKKILYKSRENSFGCEFGSNIDESLSTSIGSGNHNNYNILSNEHNNNNNNFCFKKLELENTFQNYTSRKREPVNKKLNEKYNFDSVNTTSYVRHCNNLTINDNENMETEKKKNTYIYNRKYLTNKKNNRTKNETNDQKSEGIYKSNIKEKVFKIDKSTYDLSFRDSNNKNKCISNIKSVYVKPYIKKEESQNYFTSIKKKKIESKFISLKKISNRKEEDNCDHKGNIKKKLFFE